MDNSTPAKKSLGQHWLNDRSTLVNLVKALKCSKGDQVLEVGPGQGSLTKVLLENGLNVTAVELDRELASKLPELVAGKVNSHINMKSTFPALEPELKVVNANILDFDLNSMPNNYKVIGNIPYYLSSNLVRYLSESSNPPSTAVLLLQREVAERMAAKPGKMSLLSITSQFYWEVTLGPIIPAKLFLPQPKVDSRSVVLNRKVTLALGESDRRAFFNLVRIGFSAKRKTLLNNLAKYYNGRVQAETVLNKASIEPKARAQTLSISDWVKLFRTSENLTR